MESLEQPATPQGQGDVPRYRVVDFDEAVKLGVAREDERSYCENMNLVIEEVNGKLNEIGNDGGEPEDQTLTRDWKWVVRELNRAYEAGKLAAQPHVQSPTVAVRVEDLKRLETYTFLDQFPPHSEHNQCPACSKVATYKNGKVIGQTHERKCWLGNALKAGGA